MFVQNYHLLLKSFNNLLKNVISVTFDGKDYSIKIVLNNEDPNLRYLINLINKIYNLKIEYLKEKEDPNRFTYLEI